MRAVVKSGAMSPPTGVKVYGREQKQGDGTWTVVLRPDSTDPIFGLLTLAGLTGGDHVVLAELVLVL